MKKLLFLLLIIISSFFVHPVSAHAQHPIPSVFYCIGNNPQPPCVTLAPTSGQSQISQTPSATPTLFMISPVTSSISASPDTSPSASVSPCQSLQQSVAIKSTNSANKESSSSGKKSTTKHKEKEDIGKKHQHTKGLIQKLMQFLLQLLQQLFKQYGNHTPVLNPCPSLSPSPSSASPSASTSVSPNPSISATPGNGNPYSPNVKNSLGTLGQCSTNQKKQGFSFCYGDGVNSGYCLPPAGSCYASLVIIPGTKSYCVDQTHQEYKAPITGAANTSNRGSCQICPLGGSVKGAPASDGTSKCICDNPKKTISNTEKTCVTKMSGCSSYQDDGTCIQCTSSYTLQGGTCVKTSKPNTNLNNNQNGGKNNQNGSGTNQTGKNNQNGSGTNQTGKNNTPVSCNPFNADCSSGYSCLVPAGHVIGTCQKTQPKPAQTQPITCKQPGEACTTTHQCCSTPINSTCVSGKCLGQIGL
ncbi:MAG TPA: hypothetical protein VNW29_03585 [Candidatus Sulfotelmatobacter sp.]|jgi:hypothetical protein|nr:hypothetical protein [Candidatus Sulfotelmatobacter sp.]